MSENVLYFPYMRVPNSTWFTRILLYWDKVGTLVPYDILKSPERLGEHTRSLVENNLVTQIIPGEHVYRIPRFADAFLDHVHSLGPDLDNRRHSFENGRTFTIYSEKMFDVAQTLIQLRLARKNASHAMLLDVEDQTGFEFMTYLAMTLGRLEELQFTPVADEQRVLEKVALFGSSPSLRKLDRLRLEILDEALPAPSKPLLARDVLEFKLDHGKQLGRFRRYLEKELIAIAGLPDKELANHGTQVLREEIKSEIRDIREKMKARGWLTVTLEGLSALLAPVSGLEPIPSVIKAVFEAFGKEKANLELPLAYAAFAQEKLLDR